MRLVQTAEESADMDRKSGFHENANSDNYSDIYQWATRRHPGIVQWEKWYSGGSKVWPNDIELTPTVLKHWYCGDGRYHNNKSKSIQITTQNELENKEKIKSMFSNIGFEASVGDTNWIYFSNNESKRLWEYMGDPLPDFQYKWPKEYR